MNFKQARKMIEALGWQLARINGSHHTFTKAGNPKNIVISKHAGDIAIGTIHRIKKIAGIK